LKWRATWPPASTTVYGEHFVLPEAQIDDNVATLPGLDGRKMSKSYDNTIPLFAPRDQLKKLVMGLLTDSRAPGEAKDTEGSALFQIYQAFATPAETEAMRQAYANGIAWGEAKQMLFERLDAEIAPMRAAYEALHDPPRRGGAHPAGGRRQGTRHSHPVHAQAAPRRGLAQPAGHLRGQGHEVRQGRRSPSFKQYRESDGRFHFKLVDAQGRLLLQSQGFASPKDAGAAIGRLQKEGVAAWETMADQLPPADGVSASEVTEALEQLVAAAAG
jgi:tryptophanyl-tRNA synthetase